jgi:hypothetical protein
VTNLKPTALLCDVDGTLADMGKGQPGRRRPYDWPRVSEDQPVKPIIELLSILRPAVDEVIFLSGRDEICRSDTWHWLEAHIADHEDDQLYMRPHKDNRADHEVKLEIYRRHIEPRYHVAFVLDDRDQVVKMWRSIGLTVLQVADGAF